MGSGRTESNPERSAVMKWCWAAITMPVAQHPPHDRVLRPRPEWGQVKVIIAIAKLREDRAGHHTTLMVEYAAYPFFGS